MFIEIDAVLGRDALDAIMARLTESTGRDAVWRDGSASAGVNARRLKSNLELDQASEAWSDINKIVVPRLYAHPSFQRAVLPAKISAAFVACYEAAMHYGPHFDDPIMGSDGGRYRADVAITVFLNAPEDYVGGELDVHDTEGAHSFKLSAGAAVVYPASMLHEVRPVTSGRRLVCVLWAQSLVREAAKREILVDLDDARGALYQATPDAAVTACVDRAYNRLVRLWAEP